MELHCQTKTCG